MSGGSATKNLKNRQKDFYMRDLLEPSDKQGLLEDERGQIGTLTLLAAYSRYRDESVSELVDDARERYDEFREEYF